MVILLTIFIYLRAGRTIYLKRKQLHNFSSTDHDLLSINVDAFGNVKTTEISITTEVFSQSANINMQNLERRGSESSPDANAYSVTISADAPSTGTTETTLPSQTPANVLDQAQQSARNLRKKVNQDLNNAAWSYTKCAILFFTAILITWIPSSANRVFSVIHRGKSSVPLEFMSAFVLPLQGFWNAIIYCTTSWGACKNLITDIKMGRRPEVTELVAGDAGHGSHRHGMPHFKSSPRAKSRFETESMTELAGSPTSDDEARRS